MNEKEAYGIYQQAKNKLEDAIAIMQECQEALGFKDDDILDDIKEIIEGRGFDI